MKLYILFDNYTQFQNYEIKATNLTATTKYRKNNVLECKY